MAIGTAFRRVPGTGALPSLFCSLFIIILSCCLYHLFLSVAMPYCIIHRLWHGLRLNIASSEPGAALHQLKLHCSTSAKRAIALSRNRRKVEKHFVVCILSGNHADTRIVIEPAHHALCDWQTTRTQW